MSPKKKPTKKPAPQAEEAIPGDVAHGRARDAAETQAVGVDNMAFALDILGRSVARLVDSLTEVPKDGASKLERLVLAEERVAEAKRSEAEALAALAAASSRQAKVAEAESARRASARDRVVRVQVVEVPS